MPAAAFLAFFPLYLLASNSKFVEEIRPVPTGKNALRIAGGKEYTVTRIYKKNLKFLAEFWIGEGVPLG